MLASVALSRGLPQVEADLLASTVPKSNVHKPQAGKAARARQLAHEHDNEHEEYETP